MAPKQLSSGPGGLVDADRTARKFSPDLPNDPTKRGALPLIQMEPKTPLNSNPSGLVDADRKALPVPKDLQNIQELDWSVLEDANNPYGQDKDWFCDLAVKHKGFMWREIQASEITQQGQINYFAAIGYWCKQTGGQWNVGDSNGGKVFRCDIGQNACPEKIDWSPLEDPTEAYGQSKDDFCKIINETNSSYIEGNITPGQLTQEQLNAQIKYDAAIGYWCKQLGGQWEFSVSRALEASYPGAKRWRCTIDKSVCAPEQNSQGSVDDYNATELAKYKEYKIQCDEDKDKFSFDISVPGYQAEMTRIISECNNVYNGTAGKEESRTRGPGGKVIEKAEITCAHAKGCK